MILKAAFKWGNFLILTPITLITLRVAAFILLSSPLLSPRSTLLGGRQPA